MESRFRGRYYFSVDNKGRVNVPSKFRSLLKPEAGNTFVICIAPNNCLRIYPLDTWEAYETGIISLRETPETLVHKRYLYDMISDSTMDSQGRITLSQDQMEAAGIVKEVTFVGMGNYIEIWDKDRYAQYRKEELQPGNHTQMHYDMQGVMASNLNNQVIPK